VEARGVLEIVLKRQTSAALLPVIELRPPLPLPHTVVHYVPTLPLTWFYTALHYILSVHAHFWCARSRKLQKCGHEFCRVFLSIFPHVATKELVTLFFVKLYIGRSITVFF